MFVKVTTSGPRRYVKLVEAYRDDAGKPRQRVVATLGRLETIEAGDADALLNGLLRVSGVNGHPKFPSCGHRKFPTPVHQLVTAWSSWRTRPALSLSFNRYELPRMFKVMA